MEIAALVVAVITFALAILIHSETRDVFSRLNLLMQTLPGAHDVNRCVEDIEKSKEQKAIIVCDAPKNTHLAFTPSGPKISRLRRMKNVIWRIIRDSANLWSGDMYEIAVELSKIGEWKIESKSIGSPDLENLLKTGWEPFSATPDNQVWVRKHFIDN